MKNNNLMLILVILFIGFVSAAQGGPNGNSSMNGQGNQFSHGGVNANCAICGENMNQNRTRFNVSLSNGRNSEIKIMPDNASQTALQRLRLRNCSEENMCQIELREVGSGENVKAAYELKTQRHSRNTLSEIRCNPN